MIMEQKIKAELENIRKMLQADGGDLDLVAITGKTVKLKLRGACGCCPHATTTIKQGIEKVLQDSVDTDITVERVQ
jgi:Fe-S cluster biogenesis protein NfuA